MVNLSGCVVLITGGSRGIGASTASAVHDRGAKVGLLARTSTDLEALARRLGQGAAWATADIGDRDQVVAAVATLADQLGPPDVLVNNAGIGAYAAVLEEDPAAFERLMRINYLGTVYATLAVLPGMAARRRGHVVNVASIAGRIGAPFEAAYSASKFAVVGFSESLAAEVQHLGISVSMVSPGPVATHFTEARGVPFQREHPKPSRPERIAKAIVRAIEHDRFEQVIPRWLNLGIAVRALVPGLYRKGMLRDSSREAAVFAERIGTTEP